MLGRWNAHHYFKSDNSTGGFMGRPSCRLPMTTSRPLSGSTWAKQPTRRMGPTNWSDIPDNIRWYLLISSDDMGPSVLTTVCLGPTNCSMKPRPRRHSPLLRRKQIDSRPPVKQVTPPLYFIFRSSPQGLFIYHNYLSNIKIIDLLKYSSKPSERPEHDGWGRTHLPLCSREFVRSKNVISRPFTA